MLGSCRWSSGQYMGLCGFGVANSKSGYYNFFSSCQVLEYFFFFFFFFLGGGGVLDPLPPGFNPLPRPNFPPYPHPLFSPIFFRVPAPKFSPLAHRPSDPRPFFVKSYPTPDPPGPPTPLSSPTSMCTVMTVVCDTQAAFSPCCCAISYDTKVDAHAFGYLSQGRAQGMCPAVQVLRWHALRSWCHRWYTRANKGTKRGGVVVCQQETISLSECSGKIRWMLS